MPAHVLDASGQMITVNYLDLHDAKGRHDVYSMVIAGFTNPVISVIYLVSQLVLFLHLRHGIPSTFQTLGIKSVRWARSIDIFGLIVALGILVGNCAIVLAVWCGYLLPVAKSVVG